MTVIELKRDSKAVTNRFLQTNMRIQRLAVFIGFLLSMSIHLLVGQESASKLSPTESYKAALEPFTASRNQANDLTEADRFALSLGIAYASRDCLKLSTDLSAYIGDGEELFALGQLCIFGQQYEQARETLVRYLALPEPPKREQALVQLVHAFLGLKEPQSAAAQVRTLLLFYPYDASVHIAIDQVIDKTEGGHGYLNDLTVELCAMQSGATLPLLRNGKTLDGANGTVSAANVFADAVRCAVLSSGSSKPGSLELLAEIVQEPRWRGTADLALMQAALGRQQMVGKLTPLTILRGDLPGTKSLVPQVIPLKRGTVLLLPFTLWSPSTPEIARDLIELAPQQTIYAITSWRANKGRDDLQSKEVLAELRSWQRSMPKKVSILIVPDSVLSEFHADVFPAGILIRDGTVLSNTVLSSEGAERVLVDAFAANLDTQ